jgi:hypothetical protein
MISEQWLRERRRAQRPAGWEDLTIFCQQRCKPSLQERSFAAACRSMQHDERTTSPEGSKSLYLLVTTDKQVMIVHGEGTPSYVRTATFARRHIHRSGRSSPGWVWFGGFQPPDLDVQGPSKCYMITDPF